MSLETGTYIDDLNASNPTAGDPKNEGDDHIRLIKSTVKASFPNISGAMTATHTELNLLDGVTATTAELNILDGVTSTTAELNILDGVTANYSELNILDGVTATTAELNLLDGVTATTTELNYVDGVTSAIQTQLDAKAPLASPTLTGTPSAPTASEGTNTTQIATTEFVITAAINRYPSISGNALKYLRVTSGASGVEWVELTAGDMAYSGSGGLVATDVESALDELDSDIDTLENRDATTTQTGFVEKATGTEAANGDSDKFIDAELMHQNVIGLSQTREDVTASRSAGVTYTNSTGKSIKITVQCTSTGSNGKNIALDVDSSEISSFGGATSGRTFTISEMVLPGGTYKITLAAATLTKWTEIR